MALSFYQRPMNAQINEIRLLELTKGSSSDPVSCSMRLVSLDDADIEYEALSYVWGTVAGHVPIQVCGESFEATSNLELALRHLRYKDRSRLLWVDAVCINQMDIPERNSQVKLMGSIYETAHQVVVWLGEEESDTMEIIELIHRMAGNHEFHWADFTPIEDYEPRPELGVDRLLLFMFFRKPWWTRMWTLQEMAKAKSLTFICGSHVISGKTFELLVQSFYIHYQVCCFPENNNPILTLPHLENRFLELQRIENLRKSRTRVGFLELARLYRYRIATDPHDMVYGLLGMSLDLDDKVINYQLPVAEAYELATLALIAKTGNLDVFSHVLEHPSDASHEHTENLPSWVPDWKLEYKFEVLRFSGKRQEAFSTHKTSGSIPVDINRVSPGKIAIKGLLFDTVEELAHAKAPSILISYESIDEWREFAGVDEKPEEPYAGGKTLIDAFWRTLCCDMSVIRGEKRATFKDRILHDEWWWIFLLMKYEQNAQGQLKKLRQEELRGVNQLALSIYSYTAGRRFFRTKTGYIGVGPSGMKEGDQVCVLFGGKTPFILRRKDPEAKVHNKSVEEWIFVGDAYVQGIMNGEAIKSMENEQL
ncbi:uncharacterized protein EAE98_006999 [Botrytis deweyae]|uniref:Heterokaryon incompatibility domain-containing protein n=1 Tax=Botrytis deweyae TaxID=2478750 RepID=A0ABQ7IJB4_9HELO|nr:uncharacterized protein EAE98_006999 [Botrytis deweyae]KAF7925774.1 hypothetical protein EAE98_006999 [Botrytis deweyae]